MLVICLAHGPDTVDPDTDTFDVKLFDFNLGTLIVLNIHSEALYFISKLV